MPFPDNFLIALFLTIAVEVGVAYFMNYTRWTEILSIILVNLITNPLLNLINKKSTGVAGRPRLPLADEVSLA